MCVYSAADASLSVFTLVSVCLCCDIGLECAVLMFITGVVGTCLNYPTSSLIRIIPLSLSLFARPALCSLAPATCTGERLAKGLACKPARLGYLDLSGNALGDAGLAGVIEGLQGWSRPLQTLKIAGTVHSTTQYNLIFTG